MQQSVQSQHKVCADGRDTLNADVIKLRRATERLAQQVTTQLLHGPPAGDASSGSGGMSARRKSSAVDPQNISYDPAAPGVWREVENTQRSAPNTHIPTASDPYDWVGGQIATAGAPRVPLASSAALLRVATPPPARQSPQSRRASRPSLADVPEGEEAEGGEAAQPETRSQSLSGEKLQALARAATETALEAAVQDLHDNASRPPTASEKTAGGSDADKRKASIAAAPPSSSSRNSIVEIRVQAPTD